MERPRNRAKPRISGVREREVGDDEIESKNKTRLCRDKQVILRTLNLILKAIETLMNFKQLWVTESYLNFAKGLFHSCKNSFQEARENEESPDRKLLH